jgi:hypothetical protein
MLAESPLVTTVAYCRLLDEAEKFLAYSSVATFSGCGPLPVFA